MDKKYIYLGHVPNVWLPIIDKLAGHKDLINVLEKLELGNPNQIKVAKLLRK